MPGSVAYLMRAYRSIDGSFFSWRAGEYDSDMSEATGTQVPPHPIGEYSDQSVIGFIGGPLARTDETGVDVIGSSGAVATFTTVVQYQATATACRDFSNVTAFTYITSKSTATKIYLEATFAEKAATIATDFGPLTAESPPVAGVATQNAYTAEYDISGLTAPFTLTFNVPVRGTDLKIGIYSDAGTPLGYVRNQRIA